MKKETKEMTNINEGLIDETDHI